MASDLAYQKRLVHNNAMLLIRADLAIQRVRELHKSIPCCAGYEDTCGLICEECRDDYPCPTIKALDGEIGSVEPVELEALDGEQG